MKSVNGIFLMVIGIFFLWIGATGRFPKLIEALGIIRGSDPTNKNTSNSSQKSGSASPIIRTTIGDTNKLAISGGNPTDTIAENYAIFSPNNLWQSAIASIRSPEGGASITW